MDEMIENQIKEVFHEKLTSYFRGEYQSSKLSSMWETMWNDIFKAWDEIIEKGYN